MTALRQPIDALAPINTDAIDSLNVAPHVRQAMRRALRREWELREYVGSSGRMSRFGQILEWNADCSGACVVLCELSVGDGPSVTTLLEHVAVDLLQWPLLGIPHHRVVWLEHAGPAAYANESGQNLHLFEQTRFGALLGGRLLEPKSGAFARIRDASN